MAEQFGLSLIGTPAANMFIDQRGIFDGKGRLVLVVSIPAFMPVG